MNMQSIVHRLLALMLIFFPFATPGLAAETIKIGAIFSTSGPAAFLGGPGRNSAKMVEDQINKAGGILGRKVEIIVYDDETDVTKSLAAYDRLIKRDKVVAVVGPSTSGSALAVVPRAEQAEIPLVVTASAKKIVFPVKKWIFKVPQSDEQAVKAILKHARSEGVTKIAVISASEAGGAGGREEIQRLHQEYGMTIVADEVYAPNDTDMTAQLTKIKGTDAQAILSYGTNPGPAVVSRNRVQLAIKTPMYQSHGVASRKFIELAGDGAEGLLLPASRLTVAAQLPDSDPQKRVVMKYIEEYQSRFNEEATFYGGIAWDAFMLIFQAIRNESSAEPAAIRHGLENLKGFNGTSGVFNMSPDDHNGLSDDSLVMVRIRKGQWELLKQESR